MEGLHGWMLTIGLTERICGPGWKKSVVCHILVKAIPRPKQAQLGKELAGCTWHAKCFTGVEETVSSVTLNYVVCVFIQSAAMCTLVVCLWRDMYHNTAIRLYIVFV